MPLAVMHSYIPHFGEKNILHSFIFVLLFFLLRYISHTIKFTHNLLYSQLCSHHHYLMSEHFHHAKKKPISFSSLSSFSTLPSLWEPLILFFVSVDSFRWNHTLHCFLCWSPIQHLSNDQTLQVFATSGTWQQGFDPDFPVFDLTFCSLSLL